MTKLYSLIPEHIRDKLPLTEDKKQLLQQEIISQGFFEGYFLTIS